MQNWIGIGIWIVMGAVIGLSMKVMIKRPEETPGHTPVLMALGGFASVIGGMLGLGFFNLYDTPVPQALSPGGMGAAFAFAVLCTWIYRWGIRGLV